MRTFTSIVAALALSAFAGSVTAIAADTTTPDLPILNGVKARPLSNAEMAKVRGGVIIGANIAGNFLYLQDNQFTYPFVVDLNNPGVIQVIQWAQANAIPHQTFDQLLPWFAQADPQMYIRGMPGIGGCNTSMGAGMPGFTVGC